ncbi:hypothetical protein BDV35DRAFT_252722 [Aspergillus flavus]|uniref:Uncharacterized protein n=1 Tax=Aspergillus flavus TaxID=5059 RepID=A0A5N6HEC8_ASPFL|nr:hypothetical protein BDV35DRAFT_252722 [Aspergillus flavus]
MYVNLRTYSSYMCHPEAPCVHLAVSHAWRDMRGTRLEVLRTVCTEYLPAYFTPIFSTSTFEPFCIACISHCQSPRNPVDAIVLPNDTSLCRSCTVEGLRSFKARHDRPVCRSLFSDNVSYSVSRRSTTNEYRTSRLRCQVDSAPQVTEGQYSPLSAKICSG